MKILKNRIFLVLATAIIVGSITAYATISPNSESILYDNTNSGLTSTNMQDAIDELYDKASNSLGCTYDEDITFIPLESKYKGSYGSYNFEYILDAGHYLLTTAEITQSSFSAFNITGAVNVEVLATISTPANYTNATQTKLISFDIENDGTAVSISGSGVVRSYQSVTLNKINNKTNSTLTYTNVQNENHGSYGSYNFAYTLNRGHYILTTTEPSQSSFSNFFISANSFINIKEITNVTTPNDYTNTMKVRVVRIDIPNDNTDITITGSGATRSYQAITITEVK